MKHQALLSFVGALAIPFLASCGGVDGKITLDIGFWPESTETQDLAMYRQWKERFETAYPQYELVADPYTYNTTTVGSKFLTGSLPNVFQTWFTEPEKLMKNKYIRGIKSFLDQKGWSDKMDDEMKASLTFDDEIYGIPRDGYGLGLLLNIRCLGENGILPQNSNGKYALYKSDGTPAYPTSFEEIYQDALKIQENDETKGILICSANKNGGWQLSNMEVAKFLLSRGQFNQDGSKFGFYGVMGPDEFKLMVNHNTYTNLMAKRTFEYLFSLLESGQYQTEKLFRKCDYSKALLERMKEADEKMVILYDEKTKLFEQHQGFFDLPHIDVKSIPETDFPLYSHWSYDRIYRNDMRYPY